MDEKTKYNIGILAFGSLIDDPGQEILDLEKDRFECETPFPVEFTRSSTKSRGGAPTLIRFDEAGRNVKAFVIVLKDDTTLKLANDALYRREIHEVGNREKIYNYPSNPSLSQKEKNVQVQILSDFDGVRQVLYTSFGSNIERKKLTGEYLADLAIESIKSKAVGEGKDGITYLRNALRNGIVTNLSSDYENQILAKTQTKNLDEAIKKLDRERSEN